MNEPTQPLDETEAWLKGFAPAAPSPALRSRVLEACATERSRRRALPWDVLAAALALALSIVVAAWTGSTTAARLDAASGGPPPPTRAEREADELLRTIRIDDSFLSARLKNSLVPVSQGVPTPRDWASIH
jgi:hypothetical protein